MSVERACEGVLEKQTGRLGPAQQVHQGTARIDGGLGGPRGVGADPQGGAGHSGGQKGPWVQNWGMVESGVGSCPSSR